MSTNGSRSLHWVLKIGNLKESLFFFETVLGLRVLRHEEFETGCEATCNGPYGGAWSKTMIGYGDELINFALELTYNYGIDKYDKGNDFQYIVLAYPVALTRAKKFNFRIENENIIIGPDGYKYKIISEIPGRMERFIAVTLRSSSLLSSKEYWVDTLQLSEFSVPKPLECINNASSILVGFDENQTKLQFVEVADDSVLDHAKSSGRIAFACHTVQPIYELVMSKQEAVQTPPLTLPTPGKADVVVTILLDRDGYEICFVEDKAFYELAAPTYDVIDWTMRASRGGDGHLPPGKASAESSDTSEEAGPEWTLESVLQRVQQCVTGNRSKPVVLCFSAMWCKVCTKIKPSLQQLIAKVADKVDVVPIDVNNNEDVAIHFDVSTLPRFMFFRHNKEEEEVSDDYTGSDETIITRKFLSMYDYDSLPASDNGNGSGSDLVPHKPDGDPSSAATAFKRKRTN